LRDEFEKHIPLNEKNNRVELPPLYVTGKLAEVVQDILGYGEIIQPAAALWSALQAIQQRKGKDHRGTLAAIDLSASGYLIIGVDKDGLLKDDLMVVNPRCGAGSGVNINRVLQKLAISREDVDSLLGKYIGEAGKKARSTINVRADRCGVFSSSATISDKNQGIPLDFALAVTLKSEVMKTCKKLSGSFEKIYLTGGIFRWRFARDCAQDYLETIGVQSIAHDEDQSLQFDGIKTLVDQIGERDFVKQELCLKKRSKMTELPSFANLKESYEKKNLYRRLPNLPVRDIEAKTIESMPVRIGMDVGSTMAKLIITDSENEDIVFQGSYSNSGDTIETIKQIFRDLESRGIAQLQVVHIGITGSARYQVQETLKQVYPQLKGQVEVLVENYAHARGSINYARKHIEHLKEQGVEEINEDFFVLVDIGGEDTKLTSISLKKEELFDNAMNVKCSAGTGSLMDTMRSMFGIEDVAEASRQAFLAQKGYVINATCAVFLMENARKLQAQGYSEGEILASANWAIVENMARTLWKQVDLPPNSVVSLHGQTMLSDPLPIAVMHRLQEFLGAPSYGLVPPSPGHIACLGLIKTFATEKMENTETCSLKDFIHRDFTKKIIVCRGVACGDSNARCNRISMAGKDDKGKRFTFSLGGCTAINGFLASKKNGIKLETTVDTYKEIWDFVDDALPRSTDENRLVIPRSFAVSEWAYFFSQIFLQLGLPVYVDNVQESDITSAQPYFQIDTCAPQIGVVGQFRRLASEPHGIILVPQIERLPSSYDTEGKTCTINQGGGLVAKNLADIDYPDARFQIFDINLKTLDPESIALQLHKQLQALFEHYGITPTEKQFHQAVVHAIEANKELKSEVEDKAADIVEKALDSGRQVALVAGREYILNPGIYDSHVGRLLRNKGISAIPIYALNIDMDDNFAHIYWRNPNFIVSILKAVADRKLHERLSHPRLKQLFSQIETDTSKPLLPVVQVSTFRCGPDSTISHLVAEIMKKRPFLLIQSDAVIKELAHLENRVNTYIKQLELGLHGELQAGEGEKFEIKILDKFIKDSPLNKNTDVLYFPTISDNRTVTSAIRASGITCIDNYEDEAYDLGDLVREGRKMAGDSLCAPFASVYADILRAIEDFSRRKKMGDPLVAGKNRVLIFNNKGLGPCRQGQYCEVHKLLLHQGTDEGKTEPESQEQQDALQKDALVKLLVANEKDGYNFGVDEWVLIRTFQGLILQGVFHSLLFEGGSLCRNHKEYEEYLVAYRHMKEDVYQIQEHGFHPTPGGKKLVELFGDYNGVGMLVKYIGYRLYARDITRVLRRFCDKWIRPRRGGCSERLKFFISGEAYMRTAQAEDIFQVLLSNLGFQRFALHNSPLWCYIDYLLDEEHMVQQKALQFNLDTMKSAGNSNKSVAEKIKENKKAISKVNGIRFVFRSILARPLYNAIGVPLPEASSDILEKAKEIMPTLLPYGELGPYIGESLIKLQHDYDLIFNVAPEGCMVSSMGEVMTPKILKAAGEHSGGIQNLFSSDGEVDEELVTLALLRRLGPKNYYCRV
jgi:activator of 2-hydroxyglutaryl-CoA dehydratase/predicted nucleotide-binding protein (sugar kinase/HSP70/actin superfamily)